MLNEEDCTDKEQPAWGDARRWGLNLKKVFLG